ncbi:MAG: hypothetical protein DWQ01_00605 [Planctomycetota bacterium]|nr:MAG: hypothetical protein DWQ01_00605 [Planctomycetota bacterium]
MPIHPPDKVLPAPARKDLPPPVRLRRMLGPGVILVGLSLGSGEFVLWPYLTSQWGFAVFWACVIGVTVQFFLNMEIERYTLATGESAVTGFFRLSRIFGPVFLLCATLPWIWPGWATGGAELLTWELGGTPVPFAIGSLILVGLALSLGPVVYRTVETLQLTLVSAIFVMLLILVAVVVRADSLNALWEGLLGFGTVPEGIELPVLLGALAFAGAGGATNLAQSNYIKDKGYGMGKWVGRITSPLTGREEAVSEIGYAWNHHPENLAKWKVWWRRANLEQFTSFYMLCLISLTLFCLLTHALLGENTELGEGLGFIEAEAAALEQRFGGWARHLFLWTGVVVLLTTELGVLDAVTRVTVDVVKLTFLRENPRWTPTRLYFIILWSLIGFGILVLSLGMDQPMQLLVISAVLNATVMFLYSGLLLWLGLTTFRGPLRPGPIRIAALAFSFCFFGYFTVVTLIDKLSSTG